MLKLALPSLLCASLALHVAADHYGHHLHARQVPSDPAEELERERMEELVSNYTARTWTPGGSCTEENVTVRKEWSDLTPDERRAYISAVHCLHQTPSKTSPGVAPGARNRFDDFAVAHILNMDIVHFSPYLLMWHRHFTWEFEQALKNECGYQGGQPFWDWSKNALSPLDDLPMFDGSETSISGNGAVRNVQDQDGNTVRCSCVDSGPLGNWTVNVGPTGRGSPCTQNPNPNGLDYNPRCLERNFDPSFMENITYSHVTDTLLNYEEVPSPDGQQPSFFWRIESWPNGIHPIPHTVVGGLQNDIPASPTDPWFFFHHAALDRAWVAWQSIEWDVRKTALPGTEEYVGEREAREWSPPTPITLDSTIALSDVFESVTVREVMSPTEGRYCYRYD